MSHAVRPPPAALKLTLALLATAALAGCTTTSPDAATCPPPWSSWTAPHAS